MDKQLLIFLYLLGSGLVVVLAFVRAALIYTIEWILKNNVLLMNLRKIQPPSKDQNTLKSVATLLVEVLLSWINVAFLLWRIFSYLLQTIREQFQSVPEAIKILRFPLKNNPNMPKEAVWAYVHALGVRTGTTPPSKEALLTSLDEVASYLPRFDRAAALAQLQGLNALDPELVSAAKDEQQSVPLA